MIAGPRPRRPGPRNALSENEQSQRSWEKELAESLQVVARPYRLRPRPQLTGIARNQPRRGSSLILRQKYRQRQGRVARHVRVNSFLIWRLADASGTS